MQKKTINTMHKAMARLPQLQQRLLTIVVLLLTPEPHEAVWEPEVLRAKSKITIYFWAHYFFTFTRPS